MLILGNRYPVIAVISMTKLPIRDVFLVVVFLFATATIASAQDAPILIVNYQVDLSTTEGNFIARTSAQVRSGNEIPVEFQQTKIGLKLEQTSDDGYSIEVIVYERVEGAWYQINTPAPVFDADLGIPVEIEWRSEEIRVGAAIVASIRNR